MQRVAQFGIILLLAPGACATHAPAPAPVQILTPEAKRLCDMPDGTAKDELITTKSAAFRKPVSVGRVRFPACAEDHGVEGCGLVRFTVDAHGAAKDLTIVAETPKGFGFGEAVMDSVVESTYTGPDETPRYWHVVFRLAEHSTVGTKR